MKTVLPSVAQLHSGYTRPVVEGHAEQLFNTTTIVLIVAFSRALQRVGCKAWLGSTFPHLCPQPAKLIDELWVAQLLCSTRIPQAFRR